jgi:hypothetical protein
MADKLLPFEEAGVAPIIGTGFKVNTVMAGRVNALIAAAPADLQAELRHAITSGYRDWEQQTKAYLNHLAGGGLAAKPGTSWHERYHGMAVDWNRATPRAWAYLKAAGPEYGIAFPLGPRDPYHSQPVETVGAGSSRMMSLRIPGAAGPPAPPPATPEIVAPQTGGAPFAAPVPNRQLTPIITPPGPSVATPAYHPVSFRTGRVAVPHLGSAPEPNLAGSLRSALSNILRRR